MLTMSGDFSTCAVMCGNPAASLRRERVAEHVGQLL